MMSLHLARRDHSPCLLHIHSGYYFNSIRGKIRSENRAVCIITVETYVETPTKTIQYLVGTSWVRAEGRKQYQALDPNNNKKKKLEEAGTVDLLP